MKLTMILSVLAMAWIAVPVRGDEEGEKIRMRYHELSARGDHAGLVSLWREHPARTLSTIDSDLEGSLKIYETEGKRDTEAIRAMQGRAIQGARAADEAFGRPIFSDYASSFVGWDEEERRRFRLGQAAYGKARQSMNDQKFGEALAAGRECLDLALPLGDWWGTAMGWGSIARAQEGLGKIDEALTAHSVAYFIYHDLGLSGSAYRHGAAMARLGAKLGRVDRAMQAADRALALAEELGDQEGMTELRALRMRLEKESR